MKFYFPSPTLETAGFVIEAGFTINGTANGDQLQLGVCNTVWQISIPSSINMPALQSGEPEALLLAVFSQLT